LRTPFTPTWLAEQNTRGRGHLRIEDTDQSRNVPAALAAIYNGLALAGISYDEGPDKDGGKGSLRTEPAHCRYTKNHAEETHCEGRARITAFAKR
jgi:glutamyl/glutaminyl-tRNA synthetase